MLLLFSFFRAQYIFLVSLSVLIATKNQVATHSWFPTHCLGTTVLWYFWFGCTPGWVELYFMSESERLKWLFEGNAPVNPILTLHSSQELWKSATMTWGRVQISQVGCAFFKHWHEKPTMDAHSQNKWRGKENLLLVEVWFLQHRDAHSLHCLEGCHYRDCWWDPIL